MSFYFSSCYPLPSPSPYSYPSEGMLGEESQPSQASLFSGEANSIELFSQPQSQGHSGQQPSVENFHGGLIRQTPFEEMRRETHSDSVFPPPQAAAGPARRMAGLCLQ